MLDLRDDGTIGIDFEDDGPTVVLGRPKFGAYKRLRAEMEKLRVEILAFQQSLIDEAKAGDAAKELTDEQVAEINEKARDNSDTLTVAWWKLVLIGDDTFKSLVTSGTVPPSEDDWPAYLVYGASVITTLVEHWRRVPLVASGTSETTPTA